MTRNELWRRAVEKAGLSEDEAEWMELPGEPDLMKTLVATAGPGDEIDPKIIDLDDAAQAWSVEHRGKIRVVTYAGVSDAAALALMRWATERHRLYRVHNQAMQLIQITHVAHQGRIRGAGHGGGLYHHAAPEERQSQAVAAALVNATFGPQFGELQGAFGPLFREAEPQSENVFRYRAVAFAAFHHEDLERLADEKGFHLPGVFALVDPHAWQWWERLRQDEMFAALSAAAPFVIPSSDETAAAGATARELWRTAVDLYERAERRALELLL